MRVITLSSLLVVTVLGCSATGGQSMFTESAGSGASAAGPGSTGTSGVGGATSTGSGLGAGFATSVGVGGSSGSGTPGCTAAAELVYVLSTSNELYSFKPDTKQFTLIGTLGCNPPDGATPNSMAVDRNATAWVNYVADDGLGDDTAGYVYEVSTADASCKPQPTLTMPSAAWYRLGMGFSSDTMGGTSETLYVTGTGTEGQNDSPGLGSIDFTTNKLVPIGQFTGDPKLTGQSAELTGTGDATLFGFFTTKPVRVAQLDKTAVVATDNTVPGVPVPSAWAFSFWGGAFYLYTSEDGTSNSTVTRFDPTTNTVDTTYQLQAPTVIDGAGVSTCAPTKPTT
jgi:hypothetical protein